MERAGRCRSRVLEAVLVFGLLVLGLGVRKRVAVGWAFGGSDSYGYMHVADELRLRHRYALAPPPAPLYWARPPLYPLFLAVAQGDAKTDPGWQRLTTRQIWLDLLVTGLLVYFMARRLAGVGAGLLALLLVMICPFTMLYTSAALTECLAMALTAAAMAPLVLGGRQRTAALGAPVGPRTRALPGSVPTAGWAQPRLWFAVAGAFVALSALLRPDGLLLAAAFLPAIAFASGGGEDALPGTRARRRRQIRLAALAVAGFALVFAPWPLRNLHRFGQPHPLGGRIDRFSREVPHYQGYWSWLRSWAPDWQPMTVPTTCYYELGCPASSAMIHSPDAYVLPGEREEVDRLLRLRAQQGHTAAVSDGFAALARARRAHAPFRVEVLLPLSRAYFMWVSPYDELLQNPAWNPWRPFIPRIMPYFERAAQLLFFAILASGLFLCVRRGTRGPASILYVAILFRTAVLAYTFYSMPRYTVEVMPLGFVLVAAALVEIPRALLRT